jgi:hypothetical protein
VQSVLRRDSKTAYFGDVIPLIDVTDVNCRHNERVRPEGLGAMQTTQGGLCFSTDPGGRSVCLQIEIIVWVSMQQRNKIIVIAGRNRKLSCRLRV